jgi:DNA repair protein SbcC/Rad50
MKILSVEITNITSIEGPYFIDFENEIFSNIGLFGITGPVGAGKSSIIDAICLGLYNTTPRLERNVSNTSIQYEAESLTTNSSQNLLRRGAGSGSVVVRFKGIDNHVWQSTWVLRRARNLANGKLQSVSMSLINETLNETFPDNKITKVQEKIKSLIGLDFKQFTKSVILAQGDFQAFLNASDTDRAQILEKLTGTEIYSEISKAIFEKNNKIKEEYVQIENQINALQLLNDDEVITLEKHITDIENEIALLQKNNDLLNTFEKWFQTKTDLELQIEQTNQQLSIAQTSLGALHSNIELLKKVENIQEIKPIWIENEENHRKISAFEIEIKNLVHKKNDLEKTTKTQQQTFEKENQNKLQIQQQIITNEPLYKQARALDVQLINSEKQVTELNQKIQHRTSEVAQINQQITEQNKQKEVKNQHITDVNFWFINNEPVKNWVENASLLQHQFQKFTEVSIQIESLLNQHQNLKESSKITNQKLEDSTIKQAKITEQISTYITEIECLKLNIKDQNFEQTLTKQNELNKQLSVLKDLKNIGENYLKINQQIKESTITLDLSEKKLKTEKTALKNAEQAIEKIAINIKEQRFYVDKLKLENSSNVLHLRSQLQPGCSCPVCGSTEHKIDRVTIVDDLIAKAESELKTYELNEKELLAVATTHQTNCKHFTEIIEETKVLNNNLQLEAKIVTEHWKATCPINIEIDLKQENVIKEIITLEESRHIELSQLANLLSNYSKVQKEVETKETEKNRFQAEFDLLTNQINQLKIEQEKNKHTLEQITNEGTKLREQQKLDQAKLDPVINIPNWLELFKNNAHNFTENIFNKISEWHLNSKNLESFKTDLNQIEASLIKLNSIFNEKLNELQTLETSLAELFVVFNDQQIARKNFFNGQDIDSIEKNLKTKLIQSEKLVEKLANELNVLNTETIKTETSFVDKKQHIITLQNKVSSNITVIQSFIKNYNKTNNTSLDIEQLENLCNYSHLWITETRESFVKQKTEISNLEGAKTAINKQLEKHVQTNAPENSLEEIVISKNEILNQLKQSNEQLIIEKGKQLNHNNNSNSQKHLLKKRHVLLPDYNEWAELNNILGSASGDRLKRLAQQFTLDILLQAANAQLQQINNRYILERIEDTLSILVIDQYMANSKRATNSLSGGETFLVSLALSLALSTISSTQLKVESLFIDEGFGSLDPNSLETAFLALENLQNQGRMVGIISHLDTVIDRLTVKIEVTPQGNGKSKIQIVA